MYIFHAIHRRPGMTLHVCMGLIEKCPDLPCSAPVWIHISRMYASCVSLIQLSFSAATIAAHFNAQQCVWLLFIHTRTHTLVHLHMHTCSIDRRHATCNKHHYRMQISRYSFLFSCCAQHLISLRETEESAAGEDRKEFVLIYTLICR